MGNTVPITMRHIINISEVEQMENPTPPPETLQEKYGGATIGPVGKQIGAQKLGYNITVVPPGKRAFPFHSHYVNEEMFFIIEGTEEVRIGSEKFPIKEGDFIATPPGSDHAHQIVNTSSAKLRYLALSTNAAPDVGKFPDSGKFGVFWEDFRFIGKPGDSLDYWEGN